MSVLDDPGFRQFISASRIFGFSRRSIRALIGGLAVDEHIASKESTSEHICRPTAVVRRRVTIVLRMSLTRDRVGARLR